MNFFSDSKSLSLNVPTGGHERIRKNIEPLVAPMTDLRRFFFPESLSIYSAKGCGLSLDIHEAIEEKLATALDTALRGSPKFTVGPEEGSACDSDRPRTKKDFRDLHLDRLEQLRDSSNDIPPKVSKTPYKVLSVSFDSQDCGNDYVRLDQVVIHKLHEFHFFVLSVLVSNLAFAKRVSCRYAVNGDWSNYREVELQFLEHLADRNMDRFGLKCGTPPNRSPFEFAIRFECAGQEFWENNAGKNYHMEWINDRWQYLSNRKFEGAF